MTPLIVPAPVDAASLEAAPASADQAVTAVPADRREEPAWYLHRPRLDAMIDQLAGATARVLVLWNAPGSGKTTLMAAWARRLRASGHPVDWFTGSEILQSSPDAGALPRLLPGPDPAATDRTRFVFIDDLHLAVDPATAGRPGPHQSGPHQSGPHPSELSDLVASLAAAPREVRFIVSGRYRPVAGTAPLEAAGVLIGCTDDTLAFTPEEICQLAAHQGLTLGSGDCATLWGHTGGWATALALALTWRRSQGSTVDLTRFNGDNPAVADYLAAEVVTGLDDADHDVLIRAAVGEVVPLELAAAVTERTDAGDVLERVARRNTLIGRDSAAAGGEHYRYHPILLAYLQAEGRRRDAAAAATRHALAARWYSDRGDAAGAVEQSLLAGSPDVAAEMLDRFGLALTLIGATDLVNRALRHIPASASSQAPLVIRLLLDAPHFPARRRVHHLFAAADAAVQAHDGDSNASRPAARWAAVLTALHALYAAEPAELESRLQGLQSGELAAARTDLAVDLLAATAEGRALDRIGQFNAAEDTLRGAADSARAAGYDWLFLVATDLAATAAAHSGNWPHVSMLENEMALVLAASRPHLAHPADRVTGRALLYTLIDRYEHCQPVDAVILDELSAAGETGWDAGVSVPARVLALLTQLRASSNSRRTLDQLTLLMREVGAEHPRSLSLCCVPLIEVSGALDGRAESQVVVRLVERVLGEESLEALLLRFLVVPITRAGHPAEERLRAAAAEERTAWRGGTIVSAWIALAQVAEVSGRHVESDARLLRALRLASQYGCERAFLAVGGQGIGLLKGRLGRLGDLDEFARHILRCAALDPAGEQTPGPELARSGPGLTQREREVLRELPYHQTVAEIARKRNVSPNTVKTHLRNIYQKLGAANRADAVGIAQDHGWL